jgi:hypothetical protein
LKLIHSSLVKLDEFCGKNKWGRKSHPEDVPRGKAFLPSLLQRLLGLTHRRPKMVGVGRAEAGAGAGGLVFMELRCCGWCLSSFSVQPKQIKEIKDFLLIARRKDATGEWPTPKSQRSPLSLWGRGGFLFLGRTEEGVPSHEMPQHVVFFFPALVPDFFLVWFGSQRNAGRAPGVGSIMRVSMCGGAGGGA